MLGRCSPAPERVARARAASLKRLNLPDNEQNAEAMLSVVGKAADASVAYGEFRRFVMLLPREKLLSDTEPNVTWFECATCVPIGAPPLLSCASAEMSFSHSGCVPFSCVGLHPENQLENQPE